MRGDDRSARAPVAMVRSRVSIDRRRDAEVPSSKETMGVAARAEPRDGGLERLHRLGAIAAGVVEHDDAPAALDLRHDALQR